MVRSLTLQLSKTECRLLQRLARQDFETSVYKTLESPMDNEGRHFYIVGKFNYYNSALAAISWNPDSSLYRTLPIQICGYFLGLLHETNPSAMNAGDLQEFMLVSPVLATKLRQALKPDAVQEQTDEEIEISTKELG